MTLILILSGLSETKTYRYMFLELREVGVKASTIQEKRGTGDV